MCLSMAVATIESLERLRGLQRDLLNLSENTIPNIDALCAELERHLTDFRTFLRKPLRSDASRKTIESGRWIG